MTCKTCGMQMKEGPAEFHPYAFCALYKAGLDPWGTVLWINERMGLDVTHWPKSAPAISDLTVGKR